MSYGGYNPYSDNGGGREYGSDPFDDRNAYGAGTHEMSSFSPGRSPQVAQQSYGSPRAPNQNSILDECIDIQNGTQDIEKKLGMLSGLQKRSLDDADMSGGSNTKRELENLTRSIMDEYTQLTDRLKVVMSNPECRHARNVAHVNKTDRDLRRTIQKYQELEAASRREMQDQMKRQARIAYPDATENEIAEIVNSDTQVFQQAVLGSRGEQANRVLGLHKERHRQMVEVEQRLVELLTAMDDMQRLLTHQEVTVQTIETYAEQAADDVGKGNVELETAATTARSTRKKKWICLGICVLIVVIIVVAVVAYILVNRAANGGGGGNNNNNNNNSGNNGNNGNTNNNQNGSGQKRSPFQRDVTDDLRMNTARAVQISPDVAPALQLSRRLASRARGAGAAANSDVEALAKKRFVVDWQGPDATGSDD